MGLVRRSIHRAGLALTFAAFAAACGARTGWSPFEAAEDGSGGSTSAQRGCALKHRVRKRQPDGGSAGLGRSPSSTMRVRSRSRLGSGTGTADSSACVYGWLGWS